LRADPGGFIYGVTTRPGVEVGTAIPPEELRDYARRFRGVGRGFGRDCLDERVVRGIVFARLADFIGGHAKVRPELAQRVAALLDGPLPRVPLDGQGGAGEILPLMHVMAAVDSGDLVEGEGMALINGSPCATALAADVALHAANRLRLAEAIFALSIEALAAPLDAYDGALDDLRGDEAERTVLHRLRGHLRGAVTSGRLAHQAPVSYRILPQVLGQAQRAVQAVAHAAATALGSVTENPVYLPASQGHPFGRVLSTGGFHNGAAAPAINWLTASWADLALVAQRQVTAMHSPTSGLPHLLAPAGYIPGASGGATNLFGWVATGLVEEARALAAPSLMPATVNDSQNDIATPTFWLDVDRTGPSDRGLLRGRRLGHGRCLRHPPSGQQCHREDGQRVEAVQHTHDGRGVGGVREEELHHDKAERDRRPAHAVLDLGAERYREQGDGEQQDDVGEGVVQGHPGGVAVGDGALVDVVLQGEGAERDQRRLDGDGQRQQVGDHPVRGSHDHASLR
jgi:histidine ammonia-lyase